MRKILLTAVLLLLTCGTAHAGEDANRWTWTDTGLEAVFVGVTAMDWQQTRCMANDHYREGTQSEENPILGHHPSVSRVNAYFPMVMAGHAVIAYVLPKPWRTIWQSFWIGIEVEVVRHNRTTGLGVNLHF